MNKNLEVIKKWLRSFSSPLIAGIISIVCGLLLAIFGIGIFNILIWVVGIAVIIAGIFRLYLRISLYRNNGAGPMDIVFDCIPIVVGILLMVFKSGVLASLINIIGIVICVWSVYRLVKLLIHIPKNKGKEFWTELSTACVLLIVAIVLLAFKGIAEILGGIILVLVGIELIREDISGKGKKKGKNVYGAKFRDITNEKDNGKNN